MFTRAFHQLFGRRFKFQHIYFKVKARAKVSLNLFLFTVLVYGRVQTKLIKLYLNHRVTSFLPSYPFLAWLKKNRKRGGRERTLGERVFPTLCYILNQPVWLWTVRHDIIKIHIFHFGCQGKNGAKYKLKFRGGGLRNDFKKFLYTPLYILDIFQC